MAVLTPSVWYANFGDGSTTGYYALTKWVLNTAYTVGLIRRQSAAPAVGSERVFVCIVAGTSGGTEPTWVLTKGAKTTDNTVTWMECSGNPALNGDLTNTPLSSANRSGAQTLGNIITNNTQDHYFICTTAGTTGAGEPTYSTTTGATTADNTCTWTCLGTVGTFTAWNAPIPRVALALSSTWVAAGGTLYVSSIHAETQATNITETSGSASAITKIVCIAQGGSIPPVSGNVTTGASITQTGAVTTLTLAGYSYYRGLTFNIGSGANTNAFSAGGSTGYMKLDTCSIVLVATTTNTITFGTDTAKVELVNTSIVFANLNSKINWAGSVVWKEGTLTSTAGTWPTALFGAVSITGTFFLEDVDLSTFAGTNYVANQTAGNKYVFNHCKTPAAIVAAPALAGPYAQTIDIISCDNAGAIYRHERWWYEGQHLITTTAVRTGGAGDGTTPFAWAVTTTANSTWVDPFECLPLTIWNATTGANVIVTIEGAYNGAALPNNDDIWIDVRYLGTASSTLGSLISETKANIVAAGVALTATTSLWGGSAPARQNSHAYVLNDQIQATGTGGVVLLWICTTPGTSNGSLPAGYASATDGGTVTDGTAVFRAVVRFKMTVTLTGPQPQSAGLIAAYVRVAKLSSAFFVDPVITLS